MKNLFKIFAVAVFAITLASCGSSTGVYGSNYPNRYPNERVYRAPDGGVYRQGEIYRDRSGNVYQNGVLIRRAEPTVIVVDNRYPQNLPPGQAKKVYGYKSAKVFAPGHRKHHDDDYYNDGYGRDEKYYKKYKKEKHHDRDDD